jgi:formate hydrogenlyase subunit 6/NADH:ubiquinone oxidoreductase subunit I
MRPGKMIRQVFCSLFQRPATSKYPDKKDESPSVLRGKLKFNPALCIGCKMCMRDCPSGAINIVKTGEKQFEAQINLAKCIYCAQCVDSCPKKALECTTEFELAELDKGKLKIVFNAEPKAEDQKQD